MNTFHPYHRFMSDAAINQAKIERGRSKVSEKRASKRDGASSDQGDCDDDLGRVVNNHSASSLSNRDSTDSFITTMNTFHPHHRFMSDATMAQARIARSLSKNEDSKDGKKAAGDDGPRDANFSGSNISNRVSGDSVACTASK
ncbi:hypothetical protein SPRG_15230 [Saprolegnia parasitica CBS 223.65]|uniref:Uncharacterized protein n=1 Tax=Saprolegnia parasitica (strain CBS 223.65) TaxID=695850 RepID=A0A067BYA4_SAPPC|nr:hypothetical protein SPRG_15230 [Saprolegnia parasitica CBS 223.65]KDO19291.1 hypothetical protein SPRG_15230 [Saprolegnia parasitica CBS 223.65]|eukprot:XP_012210002.1 hypothetical protein SPRG_15230 [Saprolegnia parasitica CBS 223.65]